MDSGKEQVPVKTKERSVDADAGVDFVALAPIVCRRFVDLQGLDGAAMM